MAGPPFKSFHFSDPGGQFGVPRLPLGSHLGLQDKVGAVLLHDPVRLLHLPDVRGGQLTNLRSLNRVLLAQAPVIIPQPEQHDGGHGIPNVFNDGAEAESRHP